MTDTAKQLTDLSGVSDDPHATHSFLVLCTAVDLVTGTCTVDSPDGGGDTLTEVQYIGAPPTVGAMVIYSTFDKHGIVIGGYVPAGSGTEFFSGRMAANTPLAAPNTLYPLTMDTYATGPSDWLRGSGFQRVPVAGWYLCNITVGFGPGGVTAAGTRAITLQDNLDVVLWSAQSHAENFSVTVNMTTVLHFAFDYRIKVYASYQQTGATGLNALAANTTATYLLLKRD